MAHRMAASASAVCPALEYPCTQHGGLGYFNLGRTFQAAARHGGSGWACLEVGLQRAQAGEMLQSALSALVVCPAFIWPWATFCLSERPAVMQQCACTRRAYPLQATISPERELGGRLQVARSMMHHGSCCGTPMCSPKDLRQSSAGSHGVAL